MIDFAEKIARFQRLDLVGSGTLFHSTCSPIMKPELGVSQRKAFLPTAIPTKIIPGMIRIGTIPIVCVMPHGIEVAFGWRCDPNEDPNGAMMCDL